MLAADPAARPARKRDLAMWLEGRIVPEWSPAEPGAAVRRRRIGPLFGRSHDVPDPPRPQISVATVCRLGRSGRRSARDRLLDRYDYGVVSEARLHAQNCRQTVAARPSGLTADGVSASPADWAAEPACARAKMKSPPGEEVRRAFRISADIKGGG